MNKHDTLYLISSEQSKKLEDLLLELNRKHDQLVDLISQKGSDNSINQQFTLKEIAQIKKVSDKTVYRWITNGAKIKDESTGEEITIKLKAVQVNGKWLVSAKDLNDFFSYGLN